MALDALSRGACVKIKGGDFTDPVTLQVKNIKSLSETRFRCQFTDGQDSVEGRLASQLGELVTSGELKDGSIAKLCSYVAQHVDGNIVVMATELEVVGHSPMETDAAVMVHLTPEAKKNPAVHRVIKEEPAGPSGAGVRGSPMPTPSPSEALKAAAKTPATHAPSPGCYPTPPMSERKSFHSIAALHPYDEGWCIKAKLARKAPLRSINGKSGQPTALLNVELIDEQGKSIQGTFWRQQAERNNEVLQEGKVYVFTRFQVKPANKQYATVKNDYEIHFFDRTEVAEAADQNTATMEAAVDITPIAQLPKHITRKLPVDVLGVVTSLGSVGTVKRKVDQSELMRRDVTIADQSGKSVNLTLWGENASAKASELEGKEGAILQCTACRVTDYNGCSLSTLSRSVVTISPSSEEADTLRKWWEAEGRTATFTPVGQEAGRTSGGGAGGRRDQQHFIADLAPAGQALPEPDAKPAYHNVALSVSLINTEQTLYYLAHPETGRKVVDQGGKFYCEFDGSTIERAEHRYVLNVKASDFTGEAYLSIFNEQAEQVLGISANDLAALKAKDEDAFKARLKRAQWRDWNMTISTKTREYQGERKLRHTAMRVEPLDFSTMGHKLLELIAKY